MIIEIPTEQETEFQEIMSQYRKRSYRSPIAKCPKCGKIAYGRMYDCPYCKEYDNTITYSR